MQRKSRNILIVLLLSIFIYNTFGFLILHPLFENHLKNLGISEAKYPTEKSPIEKIVLKKEEILGRIIDYERLDSKEFRLNGKMYDIVKEIETDQLITFYCINDTREDGYKKEFGKKFENNLANRRQRSNANNIFKVIISEAITQPSENSTAVDKLAYGSFIPPIYFSDWKEIPSPPPQDISSM